MLSIIIPTFNEATTIGSTISYLQRLQGDFEIIVVDGNSRDSTRKIAEQLNVKVIKSKLGIGNQLFTGINNANGDYFLFLHADTKLPEDAIVRLNAISQDGRTEGGAFIYKYDKFNPLLSLHSFINNINSKIFKNYLGEQAIFLSKNAFMNYFSKEAFSESILFENKIINRCFKQNNLYTELLEGPVIASGRRFKRFGVSAFCKINASRLLNAIGVSEYKLKKFLPAVR